MSREWDATTYQQVSQPHQDWGAQVLDRLELRGDETVLDLGIGTGRVTEQLLERLPAGRVVGIDGSAAMLATARERLPADRVTLIHSDLLAFTVPTPADAAVSSATFHWIADHDALFARVRAALRRGAPFVGQCGGHGNIAEVMAVMDAVAQDEPFAAALGGWPGPWNYATAEQTRERLQRAGFSVQACFLNDSPVTNARPRDFLGKVILGAHLDRLAPKDRDAYVDAVLARLGDPPVFDYVRLNWVATAV